MISDSGLLFWATLYMLTADDKYVWQWRAGCWCHQSLYIFATHNLNGRSEIARLDNAAPCRSNSGVGAL